jgi:hypothetical protein
MARYTRAIFFARFLWLVRSVPACLWVDRIAPEIDIEPKLGAR